MTIHQQEQAKAAYQAKVQANEDPKIDWYVPPFEQSEMIKFHLYVEGIKTGWYVEKASVKTWCLYGPDNYEDPISMNTSRPLCQATAVWLFGIYSAI